MIKIIRPRQTIPFILWLVLLGLLLTTYDRAQADEKIYRIGLTPVFLADRTAFIERWQAYMTRQLQSPVQFVQRQTYQEVTDLLLAGELDAAWLCGYPFIANRDQLKLLAVPTFNKRPWYRSYLIVPASDWDTRSLLDLKGSVFAYSDPNSNSGFLYPQVRMIDQGINPRYFFRMSFFTWSHKDVIRAVAEGVANAGAVDGYVWETIAKINPDLARQTRVVSRSEEFGFPPVVVSQNIQPEHETALKAVLLNMAQNREGRELLATLNLTGFIDSGIELYDGISGLVDTLKSQQ